MGAEKETPKKRETSSLKAFAKYTSFNVLGMMGLSCYILADTFFIAKSMGADGLTALNLAIPMYNLIHGCGLMIGMGGGIRYSILKSRESGGEVNRVFTTAGTLTALVGGAFTLIGLLFSGQLARLMGAYGTVFSMTRVYLKMIFLFAPVFMTNNLLLCFVRNDGAPQLSMAAMLGGSFSNIILDYVFMFPLKMGIFGAVLATCMAPVISMGILSPFFIKKRNHFHWEKGGVRKRLAGKICAGGLPSLITELSSGLVIMIFNQIILNLEGNLGVAAYGVIANISLVAVSIDSGIGQGIQPLISENYGKGQKRESARILVYAVVLAAFLGAAVYVWAFGWADGIVLAFNSQRNGELQAIAVKGMKCYFSMCAFAGINIVLSVYFAAVEKEIYAHVLSFLRGFLLIVPAAFLMSALWGMTGVWLACPVTELIVCVIGILFFREGKSGG